LLSAAAGYCVADHDPDEVVAEHARWTLNKIGSSGDLAIEIEKR
jgi:hypothetical protein